MFSLVGVVLSAIPMLFTAIAVWLESGSPVIYRQERVGQFGRRFTVYKFRSMRTDAETDKPVWAREGDSRVTRVGRFIRLTRPWSSTPLCIAVRDPDALAPAARTLLAHLGVLPAAGA